MLSLRQRLNFIPDKPGVYFFYNRQQEIIYVGKATSLKYRVLSYFIEKKPVRVIEELFHEVSQVKWRVTDSVLEAIILEALYIKKFQPNYNLIGKDDKSWNYIVITKEEYPRVMMIREHELKQGTVSEALGLGFRFGPFPGLNTEATLKILRRLFKFSTCQLKTSKPRKPCFYYQIGQCLGVCTEKISSVEYKKKVINPLLKFLSGQKKRLVFSLKKEMRQAAEAFFYEEAGRLRDQIASLQRIQDVALLNESFFHDKKKLETRNPRSGSKDSKLEIAKIEGYDISNLGATSRVGSMVVFVDGEPDKSQYRRFRIKVVIGQSDVACLEEVMRRRLKHATLAPPIWPLPDLFLIDGGKPQVNRVQKMFKEQNIKIPIIGIVKGLSRKKNDFIITEKRNDLIGWVVKNKKTLIRVRDEAHRFAITYHRKLIRTR